MSSTLTSFEKGMYNHLWCLCFPEKAKRRDKAGYQKYKDTYLKNSKKWRLANPDKCAISRKKWIEANPDKNKFSKQKYSRKPTARLRHSCRERVRRAIFGLKKVGHTHELLGCTYRFYKTFLEKQFVPGMSWANYGQWHIDHIKPISSFDLTTSVDQKAAFHYTNTQPLWAEDNLAKGAQI